MSVSISKIVSLTLAACVIACAPNRSSTPTDSGNPMVEAGAPVIDSGSPPTDAGSHDAGQFDAGSPDAGVHDAGPADAGPTIDAGPSKWVTGYYVGYSESLYPPDSIDWNGLTHIVVGPVIPKGDGSLDTTYSIDATNGPILAQTLVQLAHQNGKKAMAWVGGAGVVTGWEGAAAQGNLTAFVQNLVKLTQDPGYDGLDLDWEPMSSTDEPKFQALAQALRNALPHGILTFPVGWVNSNSPQVDAFYGTVAPQLDQINIMSYGMAGAWQGWESWHSSALTGESSTTPSSIDSSVKAYLAAGVPSAQLGIGIGFYGLCWTPPVTGPRATLGSSTVVADDNTMSFTNIMSNYYAASDLQWDSMAQVPYLSFATATGPSGCSFISYDDSQSILLKAQYVKTQGLGGAIVWNINEGFLPTQPAGSQNPLMDALEQGFLH